MAVRAIPVRCLTLLAARLLLAAPAAVGQELEPGAYSPAPTGYNIAVLAASHSAGDVAFDPATAATDTTARVTATAAAYVRSFAAAGRSASIALAVPYVDGSADGFYLGAPASAHRAGLADPSLRLAINLYGAPAMTPREFAQYRRDTVVGASLVVVGPFGSYDSTKIVNIGANRVSVRPELGVSQALGRFTLESDLGIWIYGDNRDYSGGRTRAQEPIGSLQGHVIYTLYPRAWLALDANYYLGGRVTVNGHQTAAAQHNSRVGATLAVPLTRGQSIKFAYSRGARVTIGGDFSTYALTYQVGWADRH